MTEISAWNRPLFRLIVLDEASDFIDSLPDKAREKVLYNIRKVRHGVKDAELFKKLGESDIWEFRTLYQGEAYRLLAFWDKDEETLIVATHGFKKKSQKVPQDEIAHAESIRQTYYNDK